MQDAVVRIFQLLSENRMQSKELAEHLGLKPASVSDWKSGRAKPTVEQIMKISNLFSVSTDYILFGTDPAASSSPGAEEILYLWNRLDDAGRTLVKAKAIEELRRLEG